MKKEGRKASAMYQRITEKEKGVKGRSLQNIILIKPFDNWQRPEMSLVNINIESNSFQDFSKTLKFSFNILI